MIITLHSSAFSTEALQDPVLFETRWQIASDALFTDILVDTWYDSDNLTEFVYDLVDAVFVRIQHRDSFGLISEWSESLFVSVSFVRRTLETAWAFAFDGHIFYVINFIEEPALIFDITTKQWYRWYGQQGELEPFWNMFRGIMWHGRVLACGVQGSQVWELDPHSFLDEEATPIERVVTGFQPIRGSASQRQGSLRITARKEDAAEPATLTMRFSDDRGRTWSNPRSVLLAANSYSQRIEFRSLGRMRAPGRLWEIGDEGGFVRIDGADADLEGEE